MKNAALYTDKLSLPGTGFVGGGCPGPALVKIDDVGRYVNAQLLLVVATKRSIGFSRIW